jgi:hypothetical protein
MIGLRHVRAIRETIARFLAPHRNRSMSDWTGWIEVCLESALLALSFAAVFEGARRLVAQGPSRAVALVLAIAMAVPVYEGWASLRLSRTLTLLARQPAAMQASEPPGGWEKAAMSPTERTAVSTNAAALNFRLTGKRGQVIDADGNRVRFQPSDDDLAGRDSLVHGQKGTEDAASQFLERGVRLLASTAAFLLVGLGLGAWQRRRPGAPARARGAAT